MIHKHRDEKILNIWVKTRASRNEILGYQNDLLRLRVTASPVDGEANLLVRKILAQALGIPPSRVEIIRGEKGRMKKVRILGASLDQLSKLGNPPG